MVVFPERDGPSMNSRKRRSAVCCSIDRGPGRISPKPRKARVLPIARLPGLLPAGEKHCAVARRKECFQASAARPARSSRHCPHERRKALELGLVVALVASRQPVQLQQQIDLGRTRREARKRDENIEGAVVARIRASTRLRCPAYRPR